MLDGLRIMSKNWMGRAILAAFAGLIVVGFGIFGIRDVFTNFRSNQLATIGDAEIGVDQFRNEYQTALQRVQRQARRPITNEEARAAGFDRQVLSRIITDAALDQNAKKLGLAISDAEIARVIKADKTFAGPSGAFDQAKFDSLLRDNGYTEASFVREQRALALRQQITEAVTGALNPPDALLAALNVYGNETRKADYFTLAAPHPASLPTPTDDEIKAYYDMRKDLYRAPEFRKVTLLLVSPAELAQKIQISDDEARKIYDKTVAQRFSTPEKRVVTQLTFATKEAADKAATQLAGGASFDAVAGDKDLAAVRADLGATTKAGLFDPVVAQVAFALPSSGVTAPVQGKFGWVIAEVGEITPGQNKPFDEVKDQIKAETATPQGRAQVSQLHDKIEDLRSSGKTLTEAATTLGLQVQNVVTDAAGSAQGVAGAAGPPIAAISGAPELLKAIFASDVGVDSEAVTRKDGSFSWFEINAIEPSRQLPLADVRPAVVKALNQSNAQKQVAEKANELARQIDGGAKIEDVAKANGLTAQQATAIKRNGAPGLTDSAVAQIFGAPVGAAGVALADKDARIVFKVTEATTPPLDLKSANVTAALPQLKSALAEDVMTQYIASLQSQLGLKVNQTALRAAIGADR
jgi:peptidyl-prolyl cis-trans isomerase D